jgi:hypothetical protein
MAQVKIIAVPPGQAPDWVRKEWIGLVLPVAENVPSDTFAMGVLGGKVENPDGFPVETVAAIKALDDKSPRAAQWWKDHVYPNLMPWLVFHRNVCQLL